MSADGDERLRRKSFGDARDAQHLGGVGRVTCDADEVGLERGERARQIDVVAHVEDADGVSVGQQIRGDEFQRERLDANEATEAEHVGVFARFNEEDVHVVGWRSK